LPTLAQVIDFGRGEVIRTLDPLHPMQWECSLLLKRLLAFCLIQLRVSRAFPSMTCELRLDKAAPGSDKLTW